MPISNLCISTNVKCEGGRGKGGWGERRGLIYLIYLQYSCWLMGHLTLKSNNINMFVLA